MAMFDVEGDEWTLQALIRFLKKTSYKVIEDPVFTTKTMTQMDELLEKYNQSKRRITK
jgi:hypothetical protein